MKTPMTLLVICASFAPPYGAFGQTNDAKASDAKYCQSMADLYRKEVGANAASGDVPIAIAKCDAGDTAAGIPMLEKALKDNKITLPPRT